MWRKKRERNKSRLCSLRYARVSTRRAFLKSVGLKIVTIKSMKMYLSLDPCCQWQCSLFYIRIIKEINVCFPQRFGILKCNALILQCVQEIKHLKNSFHGNYLTLVLLPWIITVVCWHLTEQDYMARKTTALRVGCPHREHLKNCALKASRSNHMAKWRRSTRWKSQSSTPCVLYYTCMT